MSLSVRLEDGQAATLMEANQRGALLCSPRAFAPGAPLKLALSVAPHTVEAKSLGSKRRDDGDFDVRLRLVNLTRTNRRALLEAVGVAD
ncbi:MAG: hypothetical protein AAGF12_27830 [Myxococcota bacterium]